MAKVTESLTTIAIHAAAKSMKLQRDSDMEATATGQQQRLAG